MTYQCPVCGHLGLAEVPKDDHGWSSDEICPSCGFQFGYSDDELGFTEEQWRAKWVAEGMLWVDGSRKQPAGWDAEAQLRSVED